MPVADPDAVVYVDGRFSRYADAHVGLLTHALMYGTGCFEGIRGYWNDERGQMNLLQPVAHYDRFHNSARILGLNAPPSIEELVEVTCELVRRNEMRGDCYVRPLLFMSSEGIGIPVSEVTTSLAIHVVLMGRYLDPTNGVRCMVSSWQRVSSNAIPVRAKVTGAYINSILARAEAVKAGFDEALLLDASGKLSEASTENVFLLRGDTWITPPTSADILEGITRAMLLELMGAELGAKTSDRMIDRSELYVADEILLCGTGAEITPVVEVDGRPVGTGKVGEQTARLQEIFSAIVHGDDARYEHWLTPVV